MAKEYQVNGKTYNFLDDYHEKGKAKQRRFEENKY